MVYLNITKIMVQVHQLFGLIIYIIQSPWIQQIYVELIFNEKIIKKYELHEGDLLFTRSSLVKEGVGQVNIVPRLTIRTTFQCHTIRALVDQRRS